VKAISSGGCKRAKAKNSGSSQSVLQVVYEVDHTPCHIIIIPSVIGGVLAIAAVIGIIIYNIKKEDKSRSSYRTSTK
jgi:uncharacterized integral membrane protein